ncbi:hypothetical protein ACYY4Z_27245 (plasmid) [Escherichia coli]
MSAELLQDKAALQDKQHAWWAFWRKIKQNSGGRAIYPSSERQLKPWEKNVDNPSNILS